MVERSVKSEQGGGDLFLPPGFRFHPTDEEVITSYLLQKFLNPSFSPLAMGEVDLNKCEPWDLPSKAKMGEKEWYFFSHKDMKYPTGMRTNRATKEGYWKATGRDKEIYRPASDGRELVGMKKTLVFYTGRAPRGSKTEWVMHEYRLEGKSRQNNAFNPKDEWVVCKVHNKKGEAKKAAAGEDYSSYSAAGTPNVSSVEAGEGDEDLLIDSMLDYTSLLNFSSAGCLPASTTATVDAAALYYPAGTFSSSSFLDLPNDNYSGYDGTASINNLQQQQVAIADSAAAPRNSNGSYSYTTSSWTTATPHRANNATGNYYSLQHQAMMAKAPGRAVTAPVFAAAGSPAVSSSVARILQQNSLGVPVPQQKLAGNYGDSAATATSIGAPAN